MIVWPALEQSLEEDGTGRVLVVDGGGSKRCALLGDNIAEMGYKNGWTVSLSIDFSSTPPPCPPLSCFPHCPATSNDRTLKIAPHSGQYALRTTLLLHCLHPCATCTTFSFWNSSVSLPETSSSRSLLYTNNFEFLGQFLCLCRRRPHRGQYPGLDRLHLCYTAYSEMCLDLL